MTLKIFLTHAPEDLEMYFSWALPPLERLGSVVLNPLGRNLTTEELIEAAAEAEIIVANRATAAEAALFDRSPKLLALLRPQVDLRTVDIAAASRNGVLVARAPASFVATTAEMVLALMLATARNVAQSTVEYRQGREPPQRMGRQLRGSTAGIIGYGGIGSYLASLLLALGMRVLVHDPYRKVDDDRLEACALDRLLGEADFVLPLAAATEETENLIGEAALLKMKPRAILVNCSRGNLLDEAAVSAAWQAGRLGGLAMDVGRAPDQRPSPLFTRQEGVVVTPHIGGLTEEAAKPQAMSPAEQVEAILAGEIPPRSVNAEAAFRLRDYWASRG